MTAITKNITIEQGADYLRPFCIVDENGNPVDITGAVAAMQMALNYWSAPVLTLTTANGGLLVGGLNGLITPVLPASVTINLIAGVYIYDLKLTFANGRTVRPYQGAVTVAPEVTMIAPPYPSPSPAPPETQITWGDGSNVTAGDGTNLTWSADLPPPPTSDTQVIWGDGTEVTAGDGTNTTWSA